LNQLNMFDQERFIINITYLVFGYG